MSFRFACSLLLSLGVASSLEAQAVSSPADADASPQDIRDVYEGLRLPGVVDVIVQEGRESGGSIAESIFGAAPVPESWGRMISAIYDQDRLEREILASLAEDLTGQDTSAMIQFLETEPGRSLMELELAAREAMTNEDVEEEAKEAAAVAMYQETPRLALLRRYAEANDLIETNVVGTMNTNYAYFAGLLDGGAMPDGTTESDILSDVWAQEPQIRADTVEWVYSFLLMAYGPASDEDIEALIAFSETEAGQVLNRALFEAFDERFTDMSRAMGLAAARYMTTDAL